MNKLSKFGIISLLLFSQACTNNKNTESKIEKLNYPKTAKVSQIDDYFGKKVEDPYRWLEISDSSAVADWVKAENKVTFAFLEKIPFRTAIRKRHEEVWDYPKVSAPQKEGDYYYIYKNDGLQNQSVLYRMKNLKDTGEIFLDPNKLSDDGTVALTATSFSKDSKYFAYGTASGGSDWQEFFVMDTSTGKKLDDHLKWVKFSGMAWYKDGFFYGRFDAPQKGKELEAKNEFMKIYYHKLGDSQDKDKLVYEDKAHALRYFSSQTTESEKYLIIGASEGTSGTALYFKDLEKDGELKTIIDNFEYENFIIDNLGDKILLMTNMDAPKYRLVTIDPTKPDSKNWQTLIPESKDVLASVSLAGGKIIATYEKDAHSEVIIFDEKGKKLNDVKLPALGTASGFRGKKDDKEVFYTFTSFTYPTTAYKYNLESNQSEVYFQPKVSFKADDYETKQVFYSSKDGTKVPMFIVHKKGLKTDGQNPTILYAYGGFNISLTPSFNPGYIPFLENGGIYAVANLRGGSEYGEEWHKAGMLLKKQNVFDDFIAAAEYLIKEKYTSSDKLAIRGGSNGGLLVGACMTQRPELYKVALPAVGVMDMLRFHKFTIGYAWVVEYGSSERNKEEFENLYAYSPLHNIKEGVKYPATMVTTADHDDRVVPAHSFKFIATLQEKQAGDAPVLIRIDEKAGHGAGKPTSKIIDEYADILSFTLYNMGETFKVNE